MAWNKYKPVFWEEPPPHADWNELLFPDEWPLSHYEMSFLLPHFLKEGRGKLDTYFTRVYNPVWTNPDGMTWVEVLRDEAMVGLHAALTPTWSETAIFADYVLPMGHAGERHDIQSQETQSGKWVSFRQPVLRAARERLGETFRFTYEANPGEVWEEDEFWIELSWRIDPDGALGIRKWFESPYRPGEKLTVPDYYRWIFENAVPGLPEAAAREGLAPLDYMRRYGAFLIEKDVHDLQSRADRRPPGRGARPGDGARGRGRQAGGTGDRRRGRGRLSDAVAPPRDLLAHARGVGLAGRGAARLHPQPRPPRPPGRARRARCSCCRPSACPR